VGRAPRVSGPAAGVEDVSTLDAVEPIQRVAIPADADAVDALADGEADSCLEAPRVAP